MTPKSLPPHLLSKPQNDSPSLKSFPDPTWDFSRIKISYQLAWPLQHLVRLLPSELPPGSVREDLLGILKAQADAGLRVTWCGSRYLAQYCMQCHNAAHTLPGSERFSYSAPHWATGKLRFSESQTTTSQNRVKLRPTTWCTTPEARIIEHHKLRCSALSAFVFMPFSQGAWRV